MARTRAYAVAFLLLAAIFVLTTKLAPLWIGGDWLEPIALWANVLALPAAFVVAELYSRGAFERADARASRIVGELEELRTAVLAIEGQALAALIAVDRSWDARRINLSFTRSTVQYRSAGGAATCDLDTLYAYFTSLEPRRLVVLGGSGAGKTVAALTLIKSMLEDPTRQSGDPVPIRVPTNGYQRQDSLQRWIVDVLANDYRCRRATAENLVLSGKIVPILDGLDELDSDPSSPGRADAVVGLVNGFLYNGGPAPFVVLCRSSVYVALAIGVEEATEVSVDDVDEMLFRLYLEDQFRDAAEDFSWGNVLSGLSGTYGVAAQLQLRTALARPWIVASALAVSRAGMSPDSVFFVAPPAAGTATVRSIDEIRQTILSSFIATRIAVSADRLGKPYAAADVTRWLRVVARHLRSELLAGRPSELRLDSWWRAAKSRSRVIHGTVAGVLSLCCLAMIYLGVNGPLVLDVARLRSYQENFLRLEPAFVTSTLSIMVCTVGVVVASVVFSARSDVIPLRLSASSLALGSGWLTMLRYGLIGTVLGALVGAEVAFLGGLFVDTLRSIAIGATGGLVAALVIGFCVALARVRADADDPASVISGDLAYGVAIGAAVSATSALGGLLTTGLQFGFLIGAAMLVLFGLLWSPVASVRYFVAIVVLRLSAGRMPFRFGKMLSWAVEAGVLRRAGSSFQFSHQELQDALALGQI